MTVGSLDSIDPREVEWAFRDIELAHRRDTQFVLCQEFRLAVLLEWNQPVGIAAVLLRLSLRVPGFGSSSSNMPNRKPERIIQIGDSENMAQ